MSTTNPEKKEPQSRLDEVEVTSIKKILCPYDFSECSSLALKYAIGLAAACSAQLCLLHILDIRVYDYGGPIYGVSVPTKEAIDTTNAELVKSIPEKIKHELKVETTVIPGVPFYDIIKFAKDNGIDLIVMGTHGRTGIAHLLIGSVAEKVVRKASCPVLTVRLPSQAFERI